MVEFADCAIGAFDPKEKLGSLAPGMGFAGNRGFGCEIGALQFLSRQLTIVESTYCLCAHRYSTWDEHRMPNMTTRRAWIYIPILALITSSCESPRQGAGLKGGGRGFRLSQILDALPSIKTGAELIEKFGEPNDRLLFSHDDKGNEFSLNRDPILSWKRAMEYSSPKDLLDRLSIGTTLFEYRFTYGHSPDWSAGPLFICVDDSGRVIGWMCPVYLQYNAKEALSD